MALALKKGGGAGEVKHRQCYSRGCVVSNGTRVMTSFESQACKEQDDLIKYEHNLSSCYEAEYLLSLKLREEMLCSSSSESYYDDFEVRQELPQGSFSRPSKSTPVYEFADNDIDCGYLCDSSMETNSIATNSLFPSTHLNPDLNLQHQSPFNQPFPQLQAATLNSMGGTAQNNGHHLLAGSCMGLDAKTQPRPNGVEGGSEITWTQSGHSMESNRHSMESNGHSMKLNMHSMEFDPHYEGEGPSRKRIRLQQPEF